MPASAIAQTLVCQPSVASHHGEPVLLLGTVGYDGRDLWTWGLQRALLRVGHPSCYLDLPQHGLGDMQVSARHVVLAIRAMHARAHASIGIYALGAGGLLARLALTSWPDERGFVSDVISVSGLQHGSQTDVVPCKVICAAALWQRRAGSQLLAALNGYPDESPGPTAWTTLRSSDDIVATPQYGSHPTGALGGATNLLVQKVCPGRYRAHVPLAFDSLAFAALRDALSHQGPARRIRLKRPCAPQYAAGLTQFTVNDRISTATNTAVQRQLGAAGLDAEPPVFSPFPRGRRS